MKHLPLALLLYATLSADPIILTESPPPGSIFRGDGYTEVRVVADNVSIVGCLFDGTHLTSIYLYRTTKIVGNHFRNIRETGEQNGQPRCWGGGQAIRVSNAQDSGDKIIAGNYVEDYDCIAVSLYNLGPVHNVSVVGNQDDGSGFWSSYGPAPEAFSNITWADNHFRSRVRFGHGHWYPPAFDVVVAGNTFESFVEFHYRNFRPSTSESGNRYLDGREPVSGRIPARARAMACQVE